MNNSVLLIFSILAFSLGLAGAQDDNVCPFGWLNRPNSAWCYQIMSKPGTEKNWFDANTACQNQYGHLLSIADADERAWVASTINGFKSSNRFWWLGLIRSSAGNGSFFEWADGNRGNEQPGRLGTGALLNWWAGVDNSYPGNCLTIYQDFDSQTFIRVWPQDCNTAFKYVCKKRKQAASRCGHDLVGWWYHIGFCYKISSDSPEDKVDWNQASSNCQRESSGQLADILEPSDNKKIMEMIPSSSNQTNAYYWIGLHGRVSSGYPRGYYWRWVTGNSLGNYQPWLGGSEPALTPQAAGNTCVLADSNTGLWLNQTCDSGKFGYICRKYYNVACPTDWIKEWDACYKAHITSATFNEANDICRSQGASLVQAKQYNGQVAIHGLKYLFTRGTSLDTYFWIGLAGKEPTWTTGGKASSGYTNWAPGEPNLNQTDERIAVMINAKDSRTRWQVAPADTRAYGFVCEIPLGTEPVAPPPTSAPPQLSSSPAPSTTASPEVDPCGPEWGRDLITGTCYKFITTPLALVDASHECEGYGGQLLSIVTHAEKSYITARMQSLMERQPGQQFQGFWIGLQNHAIYNWIWSDNEPLAYVNWDQGEPVYPPNVNQSCAIISAHTAKWKTVDCSGMQKYQSICKKTIISDATNIPPTATTPSLPDGSIRGVCTDGYVEFDGECYKIYGEKSGNDSNTWWEASRKCRMDGGDLTSVKNVVEGQFVDELAMAEGAYGRYWIGFHNSLHDTEYVYGQKYFQWSDSTKPAVTFWDWGMPSGRGQAEDCVSSDSWTHGQWTNRDCQTKLPFACKRGKTLGGQLGTTSPQPPTTDYTPGCSPDFTEVYNGYCLKFVLNSQPVNSIDASEACGRIGGLLASITSWDIQRHFYLRIAEFKQSLGSNIGNFWIGISRYINITSWDDGRPIDFSNWQIHGRTFGAVLSSQTGKWEMVAGSNVTHRNFICQRPVY